ncbi:MAG: alcohol dehydrogenase catalytic domain-containing protein [Deltaproteobacteria bacterium]|nr:alcohol dehydrogenase catalytic domain-containing protein [Deltaproteobacteria bacterium]
MKAAMILEGNRLEIQDVPKPVPAFEEALVKIITAGVCHSDVHLVKGDWPRFIRSFPTPVGHEGIGIIEALGPGADKYFQIGDRVILGLGGAGGAYWCGACEFCLSGRPRLCRQAKGVRGVYAEYVSLWAKALVKLPEAVSNEEVSLACGGLTSYSAVKKFLKFGVVPGKPIAIVGAAGGLGHYAVQSAKAFGFKVLGVDVGQDKIDFIKNHLGADYAVDAADARRFVKEELAGGVYGSVVFTPKIAGFALGLKLMRQGGIFVSVGMPAESEGGIEINPLELLSRDPIIMSSAVGTVEEMRELVQLCADGKVKSHISRRAPLSQLQNVLDELERAAYPGRAILNDMAN